MERCETPMFEGGVSQEIIFQEVISNSASENEPLGTIAGRGVLNDKHKGGKIIAKIDEPSYIIGIASITPRIGYPQGNKWDVNLKNMDDLHKPILDQIGMQDLITDQMAWFDSERGINGMIFRSAGKQPAWLNYMTNVNKTYGNFAVQDNEMFMTLNRRYGMIMEEPELSIDDLTTYTHPQNYNNIFAQNAVGYISMSNQIVSRTVT